MQSAGSVPAANTSVAATRDEPLVNQPAARAETLTSAQREQLAQATDFLFHRIDFERSGQRDHPFKLQRTEELFRRLGLAAYLADPNGAQKAAPIPVIHIAGTKGKGSTATMVTSMLQQAGFRVGLYTSPHLSDLRERFRINSQMCSVEELRQLIERLRPVVDDMDQAGQPVSFFELTTALAMLYFVRSQVDAIVLEVGLGGRLDSTNVCQSTVTAITSIGLDHQQILGDTVEKIAAEKAGIIKNGVPLISGVASGGAAKVIDQLAQQANVPFSKRGRDFSASILQQHATGSQFDFRWHGAPHAPDQSGHRQPHPMELKSLQLGLLGSHQVDNAAVAIAILKTLDHRTPLSIPQSAIAQGLNPIECPGRTERLWIDPRDIVSPEQASHASRQLPDEQLVIVDTAHNGDSIAALCQALRSRFKDSDQPHRGEGADKSTLKRPLAFVFGTTNDKDIAGMAESITEIADAVFATQYTTNPRALPAQQCHTAFGQAMQTASPSKPTRDCQIHLIDAPETALQNALLWANQHGQPSPTGKPANAGTVVVCGSFFLAGQLRPKLLAATTDLTDTSKTACRQHATVTHGDSNESVRLQP